MFDGKTANGLSSSFSSQTEPMFSLSLSHHFELFKEEMNSLVTNSQTTSFLLASPPCRFPRHTQDGIWHIFLFSPLWVISEEGVYRTVSKISLSEEEICLKAGFFSAVSLTGVQAEALPGRILGPLAPHLFQRRSAQVCARCGRQDWSQLKSRMSRSQPPLCCIVF